MKAKKTLKYLIISILSIIILLLLSIIILTYAYEKEIKQLVLSRINSYLNTEIKVNEINFSIIKSFPEATIILNNVLIKSSNTYNKKDFKTSTDTLLKANKLFLQFNLIDILKKKYTLQTIKLYDANILTCYDKKGKNNFSIFKEDSSSKEDNINVKLDKIKLYNTQLIYLNAAKQMKLQAYTNNLTISGDFYKDKYNISTKGDINLKKLEIENINYLKTKEAIISIKIDVDNDNYKIKAGTIKLGKLTFVVSGYYQSNELNDQINLNIEGNKQSISNILNSLPKNLLPYVEDLNSDGYLDFSININGGISYNTSPRIKCNFNLIDGQVKHNKKNVELKQLTIKGSFDNGLKQSLETSHFKIDTFYTVFNDSVLSGKFSIKNLTSPTVKLRLEGNLNLKNLKDLLNLDALEVLNGSIFLDFNYEGKIKKLTKITASDYQNANVKGKMNLNNVAIQIKNKPIEIKKLSGNLSFCNNDIQINKIVFELNNSQIILKGIISNFISYLMLDNQNINAKLDLNVDKLDYNQWTTDNNNNTNSPFLIPKHINLIGNITINEFIYNKFVANLLTGNIELTDETLFFKNLNFKTLEGSVQLNGYLQNSKNKQLTLKTAIKTNNINIRKLFNTFDNFGQSFLLDKHLQGKITSDIPFLQISWDSSAKVIEKDILLDANIEITNGQLIEFEPIYKLADYIDLNELRLVKFSTLKNDISIKDRKIIIPNMEIKTNAFNIEVSGEHTFDNQMEYRLKLLLREWLAKKAKKNKKENEEYGIEENDGLGSTALYLIIKGTPDNYKISYDSKKMKEQVKESLKQEKQEIKAILKEEFGLFKKDSTITKNKKQNQQQNKFKIVWDEDNPEQDKSN